MSNAGDIPELEPLEEVAAAPAAAAAPALTQVTLPGMPAPVFGVRSQKQYYRFFFAGLVMFLGCMMPFGPEWEMAGYKTLGGSVFTIIALGIMWSSWVAISHGKFDLSNMLWLLMACLPLLVMGYHLWQIFDEPAVKDYMLASDAARRADELANSARIVDTTIRDWKGFFTTLRGFKTPELSNQVDNFVRAYGPGKLVLLFGSLLAEFYLLLGVFSGMKAGKAQKQAQAAARTAKGKRR